MDFHFQRPGAANLQGFMAKMNSKILSSQRRAYEAARRIKFQSAMKNGRAVSQRIQLEYNFNIY